MNVYSNWANWCFDIHKPYIDMVYQQYVLEHVSRIYKNIVLKLKCLLIVIEHISRVESHFKTTVVSKFTVTVFTTIHKCITVASHMHFKSICLSESLIAVFACEWFKFFMTLSVCLKLIFSLESTMNISNSISN